MPFQINLAVILAIPFICAIIAAVYILFGRRASSLLVKSIIKSGAVSPESAKTLSQLSLTGKSVLFALRDGSALNRVVLSPDRKAPGELKRQGGKRERSFDPASARFYIPQELQNKAKQLYIGKRTGLLPVLGGLFALAALLIILYFIIPGVIDLSDTGITL